MACGDVSERITTDNRRAWTWGYLTCLRLIRELKKQHGLPWQQAVTEAGKRLTGLLADPKGLPFEGEAEHER